METSSVRVVDTARDLDVVIDSQLTMAAHISSLCRVSYFQLQQLRPVARSLSAEAAKSLVQASISCRLDYCNAMFHGISDTLFGGA